MTVDPAALRAELRTWLAANWVPDLPLVEWRRRLHAARWAAPTWPAAWSGRELPLWSDALVAEELAAVGAPGPALGAGTALTAPTLLAHGPDELRRRLLPRAVTGEDGWCQLFSEPGSGSDLAGLTTRASGDGDDWVVSGQKVWSTSAQHADLGLLLARTDWDVPKHRGITCFALPMAQAGVEVRPLRQMNGHSSFNEVFLTEARVPGDHVIGDVGGGWAVALTTLAHERGFATMRPTRIGGEGRAAREAADEAADHAATYRWYPQRAGRPDLLVDVAGASGRRADPVARQRIAAVLATRSAHEWTARRAAAARAGGRPPGPEGSLGKLAASEVASAAAATHALLLGAAATLAGDDAPHGGVVAEVLVSVPAQSIAGGTDEIQRTIIGERALGLPREPAVDRDVPFRDVRRTRRP